jgi:hypothetical protein
MGDETRNWLLRWPCQLNQDCGPTICAKWDTPEIYAFERYLAIRPTPDKRDYRKLAFRGLPTFREEDLSGLSCNHQLPPLSLLMRSVSVRSSVSDGVNGRLRTKP